MIGDDISRDIHQRQHEEQVRYGGDSLCQGSDKHSLCGKCKRYTPGPRTEKHLLFPPTENSYKCRCFQPK